MTTANEQQVGGDHYFAEYQHWDWAVDIGIGPLEYAATKYLTRWRKKGGVESIQKAGHYMTKVKECLTEGRWQNPCVLSTYGAPGYIQAQEYTEQFIKANKIPRFEAAIIRACAEWDDEISIRHAIGLIAILEGDVRHGNDPALVTYWPGVRQASTVAPVAHPPAQQPKPATAGAAEGSTNTHSPHNSLRPMDFQHEHRQPMEEDDGA